MLCYYCTALKRLIYHFQLLLKSTTTKVYDSNNNCNRDKVIINEIGTATCEKFHTTFKFGLATAVQWKLNRSGTSTKKIIWCKNWTNANFSVFNDENIPKWMNEPLSVCVWTVGHCKSGLNLNANVMWCFFFWIFQGDQVVINILVLLYCSNVWYIVLLIFETKLQFTKQIPNQSFIQSNTKPLSKNYLLEKLPF